MSAAVEYGIDAIESSEDRAPPLPTTLLAQARLAARSGVKLETVLRRYFAGYTLLGDVLIEESAKAAGLDHASLKRVLGVQATLFDRVIAAVSEEYRREVGDRLRSPEQRQAERVKKLLAGELRDTSDLAYELEGNHLGVVAVGRAAADGLGELARSLDRRLLLVHREEETVWAWLGGKRGYDPAQIDEAVGRNWPPTAFIAIGEPGRDVAGWRLTHQQAKAALRIALGGQPSVVRYRDVALLAAILQDDLLASSLRLLYLTPLATERDGGEVLRGTLRAYFATGGNASSTAATLGVSRQTVRSRLRTIEAYFGDSLEKRSAEVEVALRMHDFQECAGLTSNHLAQVE